MQCRICFEDGDQTTLLTPCQCRGTASYIHRACLDQYIQYYPDRICRVCQRPFDAYESPREFAICWVMIVTLSLFLFLSRTRLLVKLSLFATLSLACLYFLRRNLWATTPLVFVGILVMIFLPGSHPSAVYTFLSVLGFLALVYTLARQIPMIIVLRILVTLMVGAYIAFLTLVSYTMLDAFAFTVYISVLYLLWFAWVHDNPVEQLRLRIA